MNTDKIDRHFRLVAIPVFTLLVMATVLGYFAFVADASLQGAVPLAKWPFLAKAMHYFAPWLAVASAFCAGGLCANSLGEKAFNLLTGRCGVLAVLVAGLFTIVWFWGASFSIVDVLLAHDLGKPDET
ncbi:hypothetical protein ICI41_29795 (plasmid) [Pseudomonas aeruginosa]|uniref:hypothetical protein n=1 Tax=Pseudomonas TaxID=286 RepID=UPI000811482E|nr:MULTISPECIES: hypothetical protein [Pseudomonas]MCT5016959.1 hypothetical protein [Pseudomonas aeruginosa]QWY10763.1 hypothetical protein ICI41_29795 [Pseudomonas aeruginosa]UZG81309.1 hypothetical protein NR803_034330 [Pseudomonas aeruginosa]WBW52373.1 hypothetical protein IGGMDNGE_00449 [Pseudomonas aeruginosa]WKA39156.1 hypothetical protein QYE79_34200 [Pseudomonas aeruginosa]